MATTTFRSIKTHHRERELQRDDPRLSQDSERRIHRASFRAAHTVRALRVDPATEYGIVTRNQILLSVLTTSERNRRDNREAEVSWSYLIRLCRTLMQQNNLFAMIHKN